MNDLVVSIAHLLYAKHIGFCIYRLPSDNTFKIAIEQGVFKSDSKKVLLVKPFVPQSKRKELTLDCLDSMSSLVEVESFVRDVKGNKTRVKIDLPTATEQSEYLKSFEKYKDAIESGVIKKAILSRVIRIEKPKKFDEIACFEDLAASYPDAFVYMLIHPTSGTWLGATPELLLQQKDSKAFVMALAGTQSRRDDSLYQWRDKEAVEHEMVGIHIKDVFLRHNYRLIHSNGPYSVEAGKVAHLRTDYMYDVPPSVNLEKLVTELHPTPAVGGMPIIEGIECILENEGYDRTYYSGIIGEVDDGGDAQLYVNLRCMQVGESEIAVYVGGGITKDSQVQEEWEETVLKSKTLIDRIVKKFDMN